jgi:hypothetical protein
MSVNSALCALLCLVATTVSIPALAAPTVYFGEDLNAGGPGNMPNSLAARDQFTGVLAGVGVEGFESYSGGQTFPGAGSLNFAGSSVTATLSGGLVRNSPFNARFAVQGTNYIETSFNQRITFSTPVVAFGTFAIDANELDNNPATVTVNGQPLTQAQIEARPFDSIDGIFRIVTERSPGVFEVLFDGGTFPGGDSSAMFVGLIDTANPFSNIILINGTSGLDGAFQDGFAYDQMTVSAAVPEPSTWGLVLLGIACIRQTAQRRG